MDVTYRIDKDILYIAVEGRVDASNAAAAEERIFISETDILKRKSVTAGRTRLMRSLFPAEIFPARISETSGKLSE